MTGRYYVTIYPHYGGRRCYKTEESDDINQIILTHEDMWDYVIVEDLEHKEIYKTYGTDNFLRTHGFVK